MKILVTGGAGYIGSVLVQRLLNNGHHVIVIDNFMYNQTSFLHCCSDKKLAIMRADARDKKVISECLNEVDAIFPLACLTGAPICEREPLAARSVIIDGIKLILDLRDKKQIIIYPTTNSGYGIGQKDIYCTEDTPLQPISLYGQLKVKAEKMVLEAGNSVTLRLATAFGVSPRMRLDLLVNAFVFRAVTDKFLVLFQSNFKRNYIHVSDIAKAFIHVLDNFKDMKDSCYNLGLSDANLSKWDLCQEIKKQVSDFYFTEAEIGEDPDKRDYIVSNEKIEKTGFKADISLQDGIAELIKGYQIIRKNQYSNV